MNEEFDKFFRYPIGGSIVGLAFFESIKADVAINGAPDRIPATLADTIVERHLRQCHGGIQGFYTARRWDNQGRELIVSYTEIEVISLAEVQTALAEIMKDDRDRRSQWRARDRMQLDELKRALDELKAKTGKTESEP